MTESQPVWRGVTESALFLILTVRDGAEPDVRDLLGDVRSLARAVGFRRPDDELQCVVGVGSLLWDRMLSGPRPAGLHPFREITGDRHVAVATPGDLLFHLRARKLDLCFEYARQVMARLGGRVDVVDETHGFKYFDERDLLGFVDGTENPTGSSAYTFATIGDEDPDFRGGSYVIVQKYLHDLEAWGAITVGEQERIIGRTKLDDIEFPDEEKPTNSHVALNTIEDADGNEHKIIRDNMPFGSAGDGVFGTYFIGYAGDVDITEQMLRNMFVGSPPGNTDRILDFSTAVSGSLFFVPTLDMLDDPPPPAGVETARVESAGVEAVQESLGIGSLKESAA